MIGNVQGIAWIIAEPISTFCAIAHNKLPSLNFHSSAAGENLLYLSGRKSQPCQDCATVIVRGIIVESLKFFVDAACTIESSRTRALMPSRPLLPGRRRAPWPAAARCWMC
jgi:hypothetical protein